MKEYKVSIWVLAKSKLEAKNICESACSNFPSHRPYLIETIEEQNELRQHLAVKNADEFDEYWSKAFHYYRPKANIDNK